MIDIRISKACQDLLKYWICLKVSMYLQACNSEMEICASKKKLILYTIFWHSLAPCVFAFSIRGCGWNGHCKGPICGLDTIILVYSIPSTLLFTRKGPNTRLTSVHRINYCRRRVLLKSCMPVSYVSIFVSVE